MSNARTQSVQSFLFLCLVLLVVALFYQPSLSGPFLFDDFPNLSALSHGGKIHDVESAWVFVSSGFSGPSGRPVALLSFLLNDNAWPSQSYSFKYTNLCLHLIAALSLGLLLFRVGKFRLSETRALWSAIIASGIWAAHPLHVSTVMYVIQRMAILAMIFGCLSMWLYFLARGYLEKKCYIQSCLLLALSAVLAILAVFSKENAVVIPVLVLLIEIYFVQGKNNAMQIWINRVLIGVSIVIVGFLLYSLFDGYIEPWKNRSYNSVERVLTQCRILFLYLADIFVPKSATAGLFHDQFPVSRSVFEPWSTAVAVVGLVLSVVAAILLRRSFPILTGVWVLFLAAHMVESTSLNLELYFEHRNYWPMAFLSFGLAIFITNSPRYSAVMVALCISLLLILLWMRAALWSNSDQLLKSWERFNPNSPRIQLSLARNDLDRGDYYSAVDRSDRIIQNHPSYPLSYIMRMLSDCISSHESDPKSQEFYDLAFFSAKNHHWESATSTYLEFMLEAKIVTDCATLHWKIVHKLLDSFLENPGLSAMNKVVVNDMKARAYLAQGLLDEALLAFEEAILIRGTLSYILKVVSELGQAGYEDVAIKILEKHSFYKNNSDYIYLMNQLKN